MLKSKFLNLYETYEISKCFEIQNIYFSFFPFFLRNVILLKNNKTLLNNSNKFLFLKIQIKKNFEIKFVNNWLFV